VETLSKTRLPLLKHTLVYAAPTHMSGITSGCGRWLGVAYIYVKTSLPTYGYVEVGGPVRGDVVEDEAAALPGLHHHLVPELLRHGHRLPLVPAWIT
jgi:hypothetical protein